MNDRYDYIVVGAGSAGCPLAYGLSSDPAAEVLMLEAGGPARHPFFQVPLASTKLWFNKRFSWSLRSEPEAGIGGRPLPVPAARVLGGNSAINGMVYNRGLPQDLDLWRKAGLDDWGYAALLPYLRRQERSWRATADSVHHGDRGPVAVSAHSWPSPIAGDVLRAAEAAGFQRTNDFMGDEPEGFGIPDFNINRGRRVSSYAAYLAPVQGRRRNLTVCSRAQVVRVLVEGGRATGVEYLRGGRLHRVRARESVILSCGAFLSPHLLQLSGIGPADDLRRHGIEVQADVPGVGQGLSEQVGSSVEVRCDPAAGFVRELRVDRFARNSLRWLTRGDGPYATMPVVVTGVGAKPGTDGPVLRYMIAGAAHDERIWGAGVPSRKGPVLVGSFAVAHPRSRGSVGLASADPTVRPRIRFNLLADPADLADLRTGYSHMRDILSQEALRGVVGEWLRPAPEPRTEAELDSYLRQFSSVTQHPVGTCRMGVDDEAVVDSECRVRGVDGLRVVDASVFPAQLAGNPNSVIMALGERAADLIAGRQPRPAEPQAR